MRLEDSIKVCRLIDSYGALLTSKQLEMMTSYYFDNLSLAEIGDNYGVSRQSVKCTIDQAISALVEYESKLKVIDKTDRIVDLLSTMVTKCTDDNIVKDVTAIIEELRG